MILIALYSNDSKFLSEFSRKLASELPEYARPLFRFQAFPMYQTSLFTETDHPPAMCVVDLRDDAARGLKFAVSLREGSGTDVMVVASGPEYAMDAYNADVLAYLLDPPDPARAARILMRRFAKAPAAADAQFTFRTAAGSQVISGDRIVFVEYSDHRLTVFTDFGKKLVTSTMRIPFAEAAAELLSDKRFVRTHASFIVNINHISAFNQTNLKMDTGSFVPVSHARHKEVKEHFKEFFHGSTEILTIPSAAF